MSANIIRQGSHDPIAYTYMADTHCPSCAARAFGVSDEGWIPEDARDGEGNAIGAVAPWDSSSFPAGIYCGTCGTEILEPGAPDVDDVTSAYIECAIWASVDDEGEPLDATAGVDDLTPEAQATMRADVAAFLALLAAEGVDVSGLEPEQIGHDFWLTRNGHGAGFWDRGLGALGDVLTKWAKSFGTSDLYADDEGALHVSP